MPDHGLDLRAGGTVVAHDNLPILRALPDACLDLVYTDPPFNTGGPRRQRRLRTTADRDGDPHRLRRAALPQRDDLGPRLRRRLRRLPGLPGTASGGDPAAARARRLAVSAPRRARGALRQSALRRHLRARVLPQRDRLGLRLRRPTDTALAGQTRHDPALREGRRSLHLQPRRHRPHPLHGAGAGGAREGGARQAAHRHLGGTPSSRRAATSGPATPRRSPRRWRSASSAPPATPATWSATPSRAAARWGPSRRGWGAASC